MSNTVIQLKKSLISGNIPSSLESGELAINTADGILFYKDPNNTIKQITTGTTANSFSSINVGSSILVATSPNDILSLYGNNGITVSGDFITDTIRIDINSANTTSKGVVQLYDGVDSNSTTLAATANAVSTLYTLINSGGSTSTLTTNYKTQEYTATSGQTTFTVTGGYTPNYISVYLNGVLLDSSDYTATNGTTVILNVGAFLGDSVSISKWFFDNSIYLSAIQKVEEFSATNNQTTFYTSGNYEANYIKVYRNGILIETADYTALGGTEVIIDYPVPENDIISIEYWGANSINATPVYIMANNALLYANSALEISVNKIDKLDQANLTSELATTASNSANQILDSFSTSEYRSVKYLIQVSSGSDYQVSEVLLLHNNTNSYITEYGLISSGGTLISYDSDINSGSVRLLMTPVYNNNTIKLVKTSIVV